MYPVLDTLFLKFLHRAPLYLAQHHNGHAKTIDIQKLMFYGSIQLCKNKMVVVGRTVRPSPLFNDQRQVEMQPFIGLRAIRSNHIAYGQG